MAKNSTAVSNYLAEVRAQLATGHAREHAYRPALQRLMESFDDCRAVNDPGRSEHGNPDMVFLKQSHQNIILGYAEAKDITVSLDKIEKTNQMQRYSGYANLFLTDYLEFRFYKNGEKYQTIRLGTINDGVFTPDPLAALQLADELQAFLTLPPEQIRSGSRLALIMGAKARRIRDRINRKFAQAEADSTDELQKIYTMMRQLLVHDLTTEKFADMYAQTLVYGLFVARYNDTSLENFNRSEARDLVPKSNPFLRDFFDHIAGSRFDTSLGYIVDELCEVFMVSDVKDIVHKHLKVADPSTSDKDPIIHFYEDFLKEYDPSERKKMGTYYTPIPVVRFIIRQVDEILKRDFNIPKGLADTEKKTLGTYKAGTKNTLHRVQVLDPAVGTATFLNETIKFIYEGFRGQEGRWPAYVKDDLLPRLYGFELMMAPYTIAHLKLGMTLQETGVTDLTQRLGVYLTNTLEEGSPAQPDLFNFGLAEVVAEESHKAGVIKHERPIMVIMGNPPYSVSSNNKSEYIQNLIKDYKKDLNERKINLDDDYIKFIRFAEEMIDKNGEGIVAMITNNSYIDGITHRQMRKHLLETFDQIYILDLHGSTMKNEVARDGSKDENVFSIQQGVAICIFVKKSRSKALAKVYFSEIYGLRQAKFDQLGSGTAWKQLTPTEPNYFFVTKDFRGSEEYEKGIKVDELFIIGSSGIETQKDSLVIRQTRPELDAIVQDFERYSNGEILTKYKIKESRDWTVDAAREDLENAHPIQIYYRPFDRRWTFYSGKSKGILAYPRHEVSKHMLQNNIGLLVCGRQTSFDFQHVLMTDTIAERCSVSLQTGEVGYLFPLYLYHDDGTRTPNFKPEVLKALTKSLTKEAAPEDILDYIYAVLHSPRYRETYKEFLKIDFPRVPAPTSDTEFERLVTLGRQLRELHLMTSPLARDYTTIFPVSGSDEVEKVSYQDEQVWINDTQYFGNVPEVAWNFYIGGYQPVQKWLKDRKGRVLTNEDIEHYQKIIKVLIETNRLMREIDSFAPAVTA